MCIFMFVSTCFAMILLPLPVLAIFNKAAEHQRWAVAEHKNQNDFPCTWITTTDLLSRSQLLQ